MCMRLWFLLLIHSEFVRRKLFLDIVLATLFQFILSFDHLAAQRLIKFIGLPSFCFVPKTDSKSAKNKLTTPAQNWEKNTTNSLSNGLFNCFNALSRSHTHKHIVVHCWNFFGRSHNYVWPWAIIDLSMQCNEKTIFGQNVRSARFRVLSFLFELVFCVSSCFESLQTSKQFNELLLVFVLSVNCCYSLLVCFFFRFAALVFFLSVDRRRA